MIVSAPGKALILGDYAVLAGGSAMVAAIDRRAIGRIGEGPASTVVDAVLARAGRSLDVVIDTAAFHDADGRKLGLGSSAAAAVVTAGLALGPNDDQVYGVALEGHRVAAGGGSGVDVAASYFGGVIVTHRQPAPVESLARALAGLHFALLYTGESRQTGPMIAAVEASSAWRLRQKPMIALADVGVAAWRAADVDAFLEAITDYGEEMAELGRETGTPIVTDRIARLMARARELGAAAKPSGAGGGDVTILYAKDPLLAPRLAAETGCTLLTAQVDPVGLQFEP